MQLATLQPGVVVSRGTGAGLHRRLRQHAARDRRRAPRADRLPDGRHQHRRHLRQGAIEPVGRAARRRHACRNSASRRTATAPSSAAPPAASSAPSPSRAPTSSAASVFEFHRNSALDSRNYFDDGELPPTSSAISSAARSAARSSATSCSSSAATRGCASATSVTRFARLPNALAHQGLVPDATGVLHERRRAPDRAAVSRSAVPDPRRPGLRRRHGGARALAPGSDRREFLASARSTGNLGTSDTLLVRLVARRVRHADRRRRTRCSSSRSATDTRYFTAQHQHLFSAQRAERAARSPPTAPDRDNDLHPDGRHPARRCTSPRTRTGARSTITGLVDRRLDRDDPGRLQAGRLPGLRHAYLDQGRATRQGRASTGRTTTSTGSRIRATAASSASAT